ncbi:glycosyltransferase [Fictibacillus aquaticus]|uniref:glycosyltransferase family 2 protein n=1 Tax=Fictibacillus aquaticus TaxID=2021314 RepID=UPI0013FDB7F6|nr:glycosyltransferase family 2 protein [Fictibacillus aquaticus]
MSIEQIIFLTFFLLSIGFPVAHCIHCLPLYKKRSERVFHKDAKEKGISIIVPCYNEEGIINTSIKSMTDIKYSKAEVIYINDGSTDLTIDRLHKELLLRPVQKPTNHKLDFKKVFQLYQSSRYPNILVADKINGGKADALNAGIDFASHDIVITLDADTILTDDALHIINRTFENEKVVAAGGMAHVLQTKNNGESKLSLLKTNLLVRAQALDFLKSFYIKKLSLSRFNGLSIISGVFGIFRRDVLIEVGGYRSTIGEDIDITLNIQQYLLDKKDKKVVFLPDAVCYTELPETFRDLFKQRVRWQKAFVDCFFYYKSFLGLRFFKNPVAFFYLFEGFLGGTLGVYIMTGLFIEGLFSGISLFEFFLVFIAYIFIYGYIYNWIAVEMGEYYGYDFQEEDTKALLTTIIFDIYIFRFIIIFSILYGSISYFFNRKNWNKVARTGREYLSEEDKTAA